MCSDLGANVYNDKPYFTHPVDGNSVFVFLDVPHMLKLIRNAMGKHILYDSDEQPIMFQYLHKLVKLQEEGYFHLANKLNRKHVEWWKHKMSVKIAAQIFSISSATALQQLLTDGHPDFTGCAATVKFCRMVNDVFDVLNSRSLYSNGFKKPLMPQTAEVIFALFAEATQYFSTLKVDVRCRKTERIIRKLVIESQFKVGFCGFILDMSNLKNMYEQFVINGHLKYILSYKLSQDHLEILFSCFRIMGGYNNNPNAIQFAASYKKLLHHNEVKSSAAANCIPLDSTSILTVASGKKVKDLITECNEEDEETDDHQINVNDIPLKCINNTLNHAVLYVSGFIEIRILNRIKCCECVRLLDECLEAESDFIPRKSFGFLRFPRIDTCKITSVVEKLFSIYLNNGEIKHKKAYQKNICDTMQNLDMTALFKNFDNHVKDVDIIKNHKYELIKLIIDCYLRTKMSYFKKGTTLRHQGLSVRHTLNKTILFKGQ
ncbi:THAP domain-containing protein 9 [Cyphomyrmex costatus]|uniref:THAP domain-containing protein 9 n=1 Tax=Cyphomyrmex costatus TaxID=456900 RepID=A0A151K210_9HYME|nr:THAP domain-containing protein 9 [Cyphomyrmex costatus]